MTRRSVLFGAGAAAGMAVLAACGHQPMMKSSQREPSGGQAGGSKAAGTPLIALSAVPVQQSEPATAADGQPIVVAQPTAGHVVAFSAICTHQRCTVQPAGKLLICPCHGSRYDAFTGAVLQGPAVKPLPPVPVKVKGGQVVPA